MTKDDMYEKIINEIDRLNEEEIELLFKNIKIRIED
jgi:hypothetical protein